MTCEINKTNLFEALLDFLPGVSTIKNAVCYACARKVDQVANPINPSWKECIKMRWTSRSKFLNVMTTIPGLNIFSLFYHLWKGLQSKSAQVNPLPPQSLLISDLKQSDLDNPKSLKEILSQQDWNDNDRITILKKCTNPESIMVILDFDGFLNSISADQYKDLALHYLRIFDMKLKYFGLKLLQILPLPLQEHQQLPSYNETLHAVLEKHPNLNTPLYDTMQKISYENEFLGRINSYQFLLSRLKSNQKKI